MKKFFKKMNKEQLEDKDLKDTKQDSSVENESAETTENNTSEITLSEEEKLQAELKEAKDRYLRLYSDFENYKKRIAKERSDLIMSAGKDIISSLLPVLDDFDRAVASMATSEDMDAVKEGIVLIHNKMKSLLEQRGLKLMEAKGLPFDADLHDAITNIPAPSDDLKDKVVDVVQEGYYLNDKVLRHAKVVVGI